MKNRLLSLLLVMLPLVAWAQEPGGGSVAAPTFRFDGDNLVIETETPDASIFYVMADLPDMSEETIETVSNSLTVTADIAQSMYYEQPILLQKSVVLKAIAAGATNSEVSTLVYDYDAWNGLLEAIEYGWHVQELAKDNANVDADLKEELQWALDESKHIFDERATIPYQEAQHFANQIYDICDKIEEQMSGQATAEPYAVLSENNTVLTFYYDDQKAARGGMAINNGYLGDSPSPYGTATSAVFDVSFANYYPTSTAYWFDKCSSLASISGMENLKTDTVTSMSFMFEGCSSLTGLDVSGFKTGNVTDMVLMFEGCSSLAFIQAGSANISAYEYARIGNPNLLVYVDSEQYAPAGIQNVVVGDVAKNIVLTDVTEGNGNFHCPKEFKAEQITYSHDYGQTTEIGVARGWESIALPFAVQTVTHETQGVIAPFGNDASNKHFWLRQLTENGLARATVIEPNTAYIISMPNNDAYIQDFNLNGRVTFSSENVWVPKTQIHAVDYHTGSGMVVLLPNFQRRASDFMTYALNVGEPRGDYPEGSVFEREYRDIRPFEAYTIHQGGPAPRFLPISDLNGGGATGIEEVSSLMAEGRGDVWYDLSGRRLQQKPAGKGVYILNGRKVVIK